MSDAVPMTELYDFEISAIGASIVGVESPDLSMFFPSQRGRIYTAAAQYLADQGRRGHTIRERLVSEVPPLLEILKGIEHSEREQERLIDAFSTNARPEEQIAFLMSVGEKEKALEAARKTINPDEHGSYSLDNVLTFHEQAKGEALTQKEKNEIGVTYLRNADSYRTLTQFWDTYKGEDVRGMLGKDEETLDRILMAAERELTKKFSGSGEEHQRQLDAELAKAGQAFVGLTQRLLTRKKEYVTLAKRALKKGWGIAARLLANQVAHKYRKRGDAALLPELRTLASDLRQKGHFFSAKLIQDKIGEGFDYQECFDFFVNYVTHPDASRHSADPYTQFPVSMGVTLLRADKDTLQKYAKAAADVIDRRHRSFMNRGDKRWRSSLYLLYDFTAEAYAELGETEKQDKYMTMRDRLLKKVVPKNQEKEKKEPYTPPETPKRLGDHLLADETYVAEVTTAYESNGLFGIERVTSEWTTRLDPDSNFAPYGADPIEIIDELFRRRGLQLSLTNAQDPPEHKDELDSARLAIMDYQLAKGKVGGGLGAQVYHAVMDGLRDPTRTGGVRSALLPDDPLEMAQRIAANIRPSGGMFGEGNGFSYGFFESIEETLGRHIPGFRIGERDYRLEATNSLREHAWRRNESGREEGTPTFSALQMYKRIGNPSLTAFVERNFAHLNS